MSSYEETVPYPEEAGLDDAITAAIKADSPDAIVVGWAVCAAYRLPSQKVEGTAHAYYAPSGQAKYSTIGLLLSVMDWLRGISEDES